MLVRTEASLREQAAPYLRDGEDLRQVFGGSVPRAGGLLTDQRVFAVTDQRILVLGKKGFIAELPRATKFIPARAGRFHLDAGSGGLSGLNYIVVQFNLPQYREKVRFGWNSFGAMLAADGRGGEKHSLARVRILH